MAKVFQRNDFLQSAIARQPGYRLIQSATQRPAAIAPEWPSFDAFALACRTRQRDGIKGLSLYNWQRRSLALLEREGSLVLAKSRQVGGSQAFILYALYRALTEPGFLGLIASKRGDDAMQLAQRVRRAIRGLDTRVSQVNDSLSQMVFSNDSQLLFRSASPAEGLSRSIDTLNFALCDEYSFWTDGQSEALGALGPAMANTEHPQLVIVSTPNGRQDDYWAKLSEPLGAVEFDRKLEAIRAGIDASYQEIIVPGHIPVAICHWREIPHYAKDPDAFKSRMVNQFGLTESRWQQEFELNFEESAVNVFDLALVKKATANYVKPEGDRRYYIGIDPAGDGEDYTVILVIGVDYSDRVTVEHLYRKQKGVSDLHMGVACDLIKKYNPIKLVVEKNGLGQLWRDRLIALFPYLDIEGFNTTSESKEALVGRITLALEREELTFATSIVESELLSFRRNGKRLEAGGGAHDDTVIALGLALTAADYGTPAKMEVRVQRIKT